MVEEKKTSKTRSCIFPFAINRITFNGCTNKYDTQNKTWCATKVDEFGQYSYRHNKGYCKENCPLDLNGTSNSIWLI